MGFWGVLKEVIYVKRLEQPWPTSGLDTGTVIIVYYVSYIFNVTFIMLDSSHLV